MNTAIIAGTLSSDPRLRSLPSGDVLALVELTTRDGGETTSVPVAWFNPPASMRWREGDEVVVIGRVRRRFFRVAGSTASRTEVVVVDAARASSRRVPSMLKRAFERSPS